VTDVDQDDRLDAATLAELAHAARMAEVHTAIPGRVTSYADGRADVQPLVQRAVPRVDGGTLLEDLPVVRSVPVLMPRAGGYFVHLPLEAGDDVLLVISEADPARYLSSGQAGAPIDRRRHHLAHAFAIPGAVPDSAVLEPTDAIAGELVLGKVGSGPLIRVSGTLVKIGRNALEPAAKAPTTNARLAALENVVSAFVAATPVAMDGGAALQTATALVWNDPGAIAVRGESVAADVAVVE
jgi:hypothetical protein